MQERSEATFLLSAGCSPNIEITVVKNFSKDDVRRLNKEPVYDVESQ